MFAALHAPPTQSPKWLLHFRLPARDLWYWKAGWSNWSDIELNDNTLTTHFMQKLPCELKDRLFADNVLVKKFGKNICTFGVTDGVIANYFSSELRLRQTAR